MHKKPFFRVGAFPIAATSLLLMFLLGPLFVVVLISLSSSRYLEFPPPGYSMKWYQAAFSDPSWRSALSTSLEVACFVAFIATFLGALAAYALLRSRTVLRQFLLPMALTPLIMPAIVIAVGSHLLFGRVGLLETRTALILSHTTLAMPVCLLSCMASLRTADPFLESAARTLGASEIECFLRITIPQMLPGLICSALFAFIISFDEPIISLFIAGTRIVTLPKRMWDGIQYEIDPTAAAVSTLLIVLTVFVVFTVNQTRRLAD